MKKFSVLLWAGLPLLIACREYEWVKKGANPLERQNSIAECQADASLLKGDAVSIIQERFAQCMRNKGWFYQEQIHNTSFQAPSPEENENEYPETFDG